MTLGLLFYVICMIGSLPSGKLEATFFDYAMLCETSTDTARVGDRGKCLGFVCVFFFNKKI